MTLSIYCCLCTPSHHLSLDSGLGTSFLLLLPLLSLCTTWQSHAFPFYTVSPITWFPTAFRRKSKHLHLYNPDHTLFISYTTHDALATKAFLLFLQLISSPKAFALAFLSAGMSCLHHFRAPFQPLRYQLNDTSSERPSLISCLTSHPVPSSDLYNVCFNSFITLITSWNDLIPLLLFILLH